MDQRVKGKWYHCYILCYVVFFVGNDTCISFRKLELEEPVHGSSVDWSLKQHLGFSLK